MKTRGYQYDKNMYEVRKDNNKEEDTREIIGLLPM